MIKYLPLVLAMTVTAAFASLFLKKASGKLNSLVTLLLNRDIYIGGVLYCLAALINIIVLKFLDYSIVMPLGALTYVWTMIISALILKEKVSKQNIVGVFLIILGAAVIAL